MQTKIKKGVKTIEIPRPSSKTPKKDIENKIGNINPQVLLHLEKEKAASSFFVGSLLKDDVSIEFCSILNFSYKLGYPITPSIAYNTK